MGKRSLPVGSDEGATDRQGASTDQNEPSGLRTRPTFPPRLNVYLADTDRIIDNERTKAWTRALPWPERAITQYEGTHHTLEFEPDPTPYFRDLLAGIVR